MTQPLSSESSFPQTEDQSLLVTIDTPVDPPIHINTNSTIYPFKNQPERVVKVYMTRNNYWRDADDTHFGRIRHFPDVHPDWESFVKECAALGSLAHPNIIKAYSAGTVETPHYTYPYIILERLKGRNLQDVIDHEAVAKPEQIYTTARDICSALAHCHSNGFIHADIKPSNLFTQDPGPTKLIDFGCASKYPTLASQNGVIRGTPRYISPEQARGQPLDQRTDIYSLGITLFHAAVGRPPFTCIDPLETMVQHITTDIPDPCAENPDVPSALGKIIQCATRRNPDERYQTMDEFLAAFA